MDPSTRELVLQTIRSLSDDMYKQKAPGKICPGSGVPGHECSGREPEYRCLDCFAAEHLCVHCLHRAHAQNPFHRVEWWIGGEWMPVSLKNTGFKVYLGHPAGVRCPSPVVDHLFHVVDANGVHEACIAYCGCERSLGRAEQLMNRRLYPDHMTAPRTAVAYQLAYTVVNVLAPTVSTPRQPRTATRMGSALQKSPGTATRMGSALQKTRGLCFLICFNRCLPRPAPMSSTKKRKASESLDPPATRPCGEDLREIDVADDEAMWGRWDSAMEGLRDFYHLDDTIPPPTDLVALAHYRLSRLLATFPPTGLTDGEGPERGWALMNPLSGSTRGMGPGERHDTLDDHFAAEHFKRFDSRPWTDTQVEFLSRGSNTPVSRTQPKVKLFPLDKEKVVVKVEDSDDDDLPELV
ncbi:hypothetical protein DFH06DRAFT_1343063 [Mycena polygramma]|nr:hypothetical protein DFH06DRAFT_1343063 [Mycena polygramma]